MPRQRPFMLTLMVVLNVIAGLLLFVSGTVFASGDPRVIYTGDAAVAVGINYLIAAGADFLIAIGLWQLWTPIRAFAIGYAFVNLIVVVPLVLFDTWTAPLIAQGIVQGLMLVTFYDSRNRAAFDPITADSQPDSEAMLDEG